VTKIDFYQIDSDEPTLMFACRLITQIYRLGMQVHIHTLDAEQSNELNELLWHWRPEAFVPHGLYASGEDVPVKISHQDDPNDHRQVLVNLSGKVPEFFSRFERVAEIVPLAATQRQAARDSYRFYQERGYLLQYHAIKAQRASTDAN
jgi:DNA polymerase-3 subunit chi